MNYTYGYLDEGIGRTSNLGMGGLIWLVVAFILALIGCFVIYFLFVKKDNKLTNKFLIWIREFLRFDKMLIENILKISYIFMAIFITLGSFSLIGISFISFLLTLVFGNLMARVIYEAALIGIMIWKNTTEIKKELKK